MRLPALFAGQPEPPDGDRGLYFTHGINIASLAGKSTTFLYLPPHLVGY
jgi:hypothetical protein